MVALVWNAATIEDPAVRLQIEEILRLEFPSPSSD
jgi:hypothetical protein